MGRRTIPISQLSPLSPQLSVVGQSRQVRKDLYHSILTLSWSGFFGWAAVIYLLINGSFALLYLAQPGCIANAQTGSFEAAFFFSVQTLATIGYGAMAPATRYGHIVVTFEALTGILVTAITTGLTFAKFSRPAARVLFSNNLVICPRNGIPHLMVRMANGRHNQIVEAQLRMALLVTERTEEGEVMRRPVDLTLVRERTALFRLTWTAMHRIDGNSPFFGNDALERLRSQQGEIFLTLFGYDETIAQTIHAGKGYKLDDIIYNSRFMDVVTAAPDGSRIIDYTKFHEIISLPPPRPDSEYGRLFGPTGQPDSKAARS